MEIESAGVVTGASKGIGTATALRVARDFSIVVLAARNTDNHKATAGETKAAGSEGHVFVADLSKPEAAKSLVDETLRRYGRIDAVLYIAGEVSGVDLMGVTDEQWTNDAEVKLHGARRITMHAWEALRKYGGGIVFMSGTAALEPTSARAAVGVINAAIAALGRRLPKKASQTKSR